MRYDTKNNEKIQEKIIANEASIVDTYLSFILFNFLMLNTAIVVVIMHFL